MVFKSQLIEFHEKLIVSRGCMRKLYDHYTKCILIMFKTYTVNEWLFVVESVRLPPSGHSTAAAAKKNYKCKFKDSCVVD